MNIKPTKRKFSYQTITNILNDYSIEQASSQNKNKNSNNKHSNVNNGDHQLKRRPSALVRPERHRPRPSIINSKNHKRYTEEKSSKDKAQNRSNSAKYNYDKYASYTWWELFALIITVWVPDTLLKRIGQMNHPLTRQAWREKVTLCIIILTLCFCLGLLSFALRPLLCKDDASSSRLAFSERSGTGNELVKVYRDDIVVYGGIYKFPTMKSFMSTKNIQLSDNFKGSDLSNLFDNTKGLCQSFDESSNNTVNCEVPLLNTTSCILISDLERYTRPDVGILAFEWEDLVPNSVDINALYFVYNGLVFNLDQYFSNLDVNHSIKKYLGDKTHEILTESLGKDATLLITNHLNVNNELKCVFQRYKAGVLSTQPAGCMAADLIIFTTTSIVVLVVVIRFVMAVVFQWFIADRLTFVRKKENGTVVIKGKSPYVIILVTCYSEGRKAIKSTLDSLAATSYNDKHKLFFIVTDGVVRGEGNKKTTPEICQKLLDVPTGLDDPLPCSYMSIGRGEKKINRAKVYAGHYNQNDRRTPAILVVKVGNRKESNSTKAGNRGKRDSQVILMTHFQRVFTSDHFTELDYELYWKIYFLMGITSDVFELVMMVDADTKVSESSLAYLVSAMKKDPMIMGCCGETRIANKTSSWVSAIQVFEYYVSHHYGKAFEAVFGGVTCLPGCFSMFRLKAPKDGVWIPIISSPHLVAEYQQNSVITLHEKNLLLLGEDRYLSTLMFKSFPHRKMMFIPQAVCYTIVPDTMKVLMSQRRRWINSTVHNLLELLFVSDLCGIACLSMQFIVFLELIGTAMLPSAILYSFFIIFNALIAEKIDIFVVILVALIIGLPGLLIIITAQKIVYIGWMFGK
ncbi:5453_t:CDS:2 [Entrophospora sp. SA101]|nr:5453_t:CDS:2 [Entrophospora sp. SA101]